VSAAVAVGMVVEPDPGVIEVASDHFLVSAVPERRSSLMGSSGPGCR
jgi:hypothetical protein